MHYLLFPYTIGCIYEFTCMMKDKEIKSIEVGNVDFTHNDLIFYEEVSVSKYKREYKGIYNTPEVYTVSEFFHLK